MNTLQQARSQETIRSARRVWVSGVRRVLDARLAEGPHQVREPLRVDCSLSFRNEAISSVESIQIEYSPGSNRFLGLRTRPGSRSPAGPNPNGSGFRGGLVFKAHRLCVSPNSRLESNKEEEEKVQG